MKKYFNKDLLPTWNELYNIIMPDIKVLHKYSHSKEYNKYSFWDIDIKLVYLVFLVNWLNYRMHEVDGTTNITTLINSYGISEACFVLSKDHTYCGIPQYILPVDDVTDSPFTKLFSGTNIVLDTNDSYELLIRATMNNGDVVYYQLFNNVGHTNEVFNTLITPVIEYFSTLTCDGCTCVNTH